MNVTEYIRFNVSSCLSILEELNILLIKGLKVDLALNTECLKSLLYCYN